MKTQVSFGLLYLAVVCGDAAAACSGTQITDTSQTAVVVTFSELSAQGNNKGVNVAGLSYTKGNQTPAITAAQVATAYANKPAGFSSAATGPDGIGSYSGTLTNWSSGPASANTVTFSSPTQTVISLSSTANVTAPTAVPSSTTPALTALLVGNTVCVASGSGWEAQEFHQSGGALIDWKQGSPHPVDPTKQVGNWTITGTGADARINYDYGGTVYSNTVWDNGDGTYSFCNQLGNETIGTIKTGQVACTP
jgi:hypothetical protein